MQTTNERWILVRAVRESDGRRVLLKAHLDSPRHTTALAAGALLNELEITRSLDAAQVLRPTRMERCGETPVLVFEDEDLVPLDRLLARSPLGIEQLLAWAASMAGALAEVHGGGVIHTYIQPQSFLVDPKAGAVRLTHFMFSTRLRNEHPQAQSAVEEGRLPYMSPEQAGRTSRTLDWRTDLYSLGVVFYVMLAGRLPFDASGPLEWMHSPRPPAPLPEGSVPPAVSALVMKLLAEDAEERHQSAEGLARDLVRCQRSLREDGRIAPFPPGERDASGRCCLPHRLVGREGEAQRSLSPLLNAARALSEELVVERLLTSMVQVLIENADAERGALLLVRGDGLVLVAQGVAHPPESRALPSIPLEDQSDEVCASVVRLAVRTRQSVIHADASRDPALRDDPCVSSRKVRSMLCAPLLFRERVLGAIYLENNLFEGLFGPERLEILLLLAAQAAVSLSNALVHEDLERRVDERTRELRSTQQRLADAARKAGMAEVADSAVHNVGNALNSVMVLRMQLSERIAGSRVPRLGQVAQLLKTHRDDLAGFFAADPRGQRLIEYVEELARHLAAEQEAAASELSELGECVSRIRDIVSDQLRNAGMKIIVEPVVVSSVVEDALRVGLNRAERAHHGIEVVCELSDDARVETDRRRLLQIVTNLITNARRAVCHAAGPDRRVLVRCAPREEGGCSVEVEDTGVGIASEHLARLFQQGFTTWPEGTGLGLHASVLEARLLGAALRAESQGPGLGAKFTLELPATAPRRGRIHAEALA
ncbi:protein kinase domain-containing protein [Sorangium sp. So ce362]|uniref:protein kinase domain-containing protein n=1 Tax=Sorangium sp. So ce362 TaxID=3133303 RepID=UPI003F5E73F3